MTTTTESLVALVAQLLAQPSGGGEDSAGDMIPVSYPTAAGAKVYAPRDWPTADNTYPAIFVSGPRERKQSLGSAGAPEFDVTSTIRVAARASAQGVSADGNIALLEAQLGGIRRQIEVCLINNPALMILLSEIPSVSSEIAFKASGQEHLGELQSEFDLAYYQGPEDFFDVVGAPLTEVTLTTSYPTPLGPDVGFSISIPQD